MGSWMALLGGSSNTQKERDSRFTCDTLWVPPSLCKQVWQYVKARSHLGVLVWIVNGFLDTHPYWSQPSRRGTLHGLIFRWLILFLPSAGSPQNDPFWGGRGTIVGSPEIARDRQGSDQESLDNWLPFWDFKIWRSFSCRMFV